MKHVSGYFYDGKTSKQWSGYIEVFEDYAVVHLENNSNAALFEGVNCQSLKPGDIKITSLIGSHDRTLLFTNGVVFETSDGTQFDDCFRNFSQQPILFAAHRMENFFALAIVGLICVIVLGYATWRWGAPIAANWLSAKIPIERFVSGAGGSLALLDRIGFDPSEIAQEEQERLRTVFFQQFPGALKDGVKLHFRSSEEFGANAFALPSGDLVFTDDMLDLANNDQELLGVFAHEWGHVHHRHVLRQVIQGGLLAGFFIVLTGDMSIGADLTAGIPATLATLAYSRDFEREADQFALEQMNREGLSSEHLANLLSRLLQQHMACDEGGASPSDSVSDTSTKAGSEVVTEGGQASKCNEEARSSKLASLLSTHPVTRKRVEFLTQ